MLSSSTVLYNQRSGHTNAFFGVVQSMKRSGRSTYGVYDEDEDEDDIRREVS